MSFGKTKDRVWVAYNRVAGWLVRQPMPVRKFGYGVFGAVLWTAYILPGNMVRPTFNALSKQVNAPSSRRLFADFVRQFCLGMNRIEQVRHGRTDAVDAMFRLPEKARLDGILKQGGCIIGVPHTQASLAMGRGLARHYPVLALLRTSGGDKRRALSELEIYENLGCDFLDIQHEAPAKVARTVLTALKQGRIVIATVDRIRKAPPADAPVEPVSDTVRAMAFGQPIGITGWPARFAWKTGVPILPATVVQTRDTISLHLGESIEPVEDMIETTQNWTRELERLMRLHPEEWTFALDKHWSRTLRAAHDG